LVWDKHIPRRRNRRTLTVAERPTGRYDATDSQEVVMSVATQQLLSAFDALPVAEQDAVIAELLRRTPVGAGEMSDAGFEELAEEVFLAYDAAEAADAAPPR
jgi:hypothetical protein